MRKDCPNLGSGGLLSIHVPKHLLRPQESRKFGCAIATRARSGVPGLASEVVSYVRLFSSDGILWAGRLGGRASCKSKDSK